jgi:hypothetical protein
MLNGRTESGNFEGGKVRDKNRRRGNENIHGGGIHLAVGKEGDGALVAGLARVRMEPFVQRRGCGHGIEQQDQTSQQRGDNRPARLFEMPYYEPHKVVKVADVMPDARVSLFLSGAA